jgi:uncharacterized repeat protein (TIGR04138 family)
MAESDAVSKVKCAHLAKLADVAQKSGYPQPTVAWVSGAITFASCYRRKGAAPRHVSAAELCRMPIADLKPRAPGYVRMTLEGLGIQSSVDVGKIVYALIDAGLCASNENDSQRDFDGVFERDRIEDFIRGTGLDHQRDVPAMAKTLLTTVLYGAGAVLVICASRTLDRRFYWVGMVVWIAAWLISRSAYGRPMRFGIPWSELKRESARGGE